MSSEKVTSVVSDTANKFFIHTEEEEEEEEAPAPFPIIQCDTRLLKCSCGFRLFSRASVTMWLVCPAGILKAFVSF